MSRGETFASALADCRNWLAQRPDDVALRSIAGQLRYLIELDAGTTDNRKHLKHITLGSSTVREIEKRDAGLAEKLHQVLTEVELMRRSE